MNTQPTNSPIFVCVFRVFVRGLEFGVYTYLWQNYALFPSCGDSVLAMVALVVAIDFAYYWLHRASHGRWYHPHDQLTSHH